MSCAILNLGTACVLPESLNGYRLVLGAEHPNFSEFNLGAAEAHRVIIVPAAGTIDSATVSALSAAAESGKTVVWESGAAYLNPSDFAAQKAILMEHFEISIGQPIELWTSQSRKPCSREGWSRPGKPAHTGQDSVPYVIYHWPHESWVRDFSRAIPVSAKCGRAIAYLGELPVAWRKPIGNGTFIFIGSPLGPAMRAGDSEAHSWFRALISESV